ncbi:MAG: carboxypeptidase-like regulatory domain-containing protein [Blastocatellia bacterium]
MRKWMFTPVAMIALAVAVLGQVFTGNITGVVTEPNGAIVANARVLLTNTATGETREVATNEEGRYSFSQVKPSIYSLKVAATGFKEYLRNDITVGVNQSSEINVQLTVGNISDTVEVSAAAPLLNTTTQTQASTLDARQVTELPVNVRNPLVLVHATAGATRRCWC